MSETGLERREVIYAGHVQGVGFRYRVQELARGFSVTGFVRNQPDGTVHLVAEGERAELDRFTSAIAARMEGFIRDRSTHQSEASGEFSDFRIRA